MSLGHVSRTIRATFVGTSQADPPAPAYSASTAPIATSASVPALAVSTRTLLLWNIAMATVHAALATVALIVGNPELRIPLYATDLEFLEGNATLEEGLAYELVPRYARYTSLPVTWVTVAFFVCSSTAHAGNATLWRGFYERELAQCRSTTRWVEYTLSAPLMMLLIAVAAGVREYTLLVALAGLIGATIPFGYVTELIAETDGKTWARPLRVRLMPHIAGYLPQTVAWACLLAGFYDETDDDSPPAFVHAIVWSQLALFWSFGVVQLWQQLSPPAVYARGELGYQFLSLASKATLGGLLLANVITLDNADEVLSS